METKELDVDEICGKQAEAELCRAHINLSYFSSYKPAKGRCQKLL